jgi:predicted nucleic acid-binding protein
MLVEHRVGDQYIVSVQVFSEVITNLKSDKSVRFTDYIRCFALQYYI